MIGIEGGATSVFPRLLDWPYPNIDRGKGVWLYTTEGREILDACSGGAMAASLGHGLGEIAEAAWERAGEITYMYNHFFTNEPQERLAERLLDVAAPEMARVRFGSGGAEANETALRLARAYHVDRGEPERWRVDFAGAGVSRSHDGDVGADGTSWAPGTVRPVSERASAHSAEHEAVRSNR